MSDVETEGEPQADAREEDGVAVDRNRRDRLADMKLNKVRAKTEFTRTRRQLLMTLSEGNVDRERIAIDSKALEDATNQVLRVD